MKLSNQHERKSLRNNLDEGEETNKLESQGVTLGSCMKVRWEA